MFCWNSNRCIIIVIIKSLIELIIFNLKHSKFFNHPKALVQLKKFKLIEFASFVGNGKIVLKESDSCEEQPANGVGNSEAKRRKKTNPVNLELDVVLGKMPRKVRVVLIYDRYFVSLINNELKYKMFHLKYGINSIFKNGFGGEW